MEKEYYLQKDEASRIFNMSYFVSQGSPGLQTDVLNYIHLAQPSWRVTDDTRDYTRVHALSEVKNLARKGHHASEDLIFALAQPDDPIEDLEDLQAILNESEKRKGIVLPFLRRKEETKLDADSLIRNITSGIIDRDYFFLVKRGGRPGVLSDRFFSHFCHYVLNDNSYGIKVYDEMLKDIRGFVDESKNPSELEKKLDLPEGKVQKVIDMYRAHHVTSSISSA